MTTATTTDIRHRIGVDAPQVEVHRALTTTEGRGQFLLGMKSLLEGGEATPYPGEPQISSWD